MSVDPDILDYKRQIVQDMCMIDDTCHFRLRHKEITVVDLLIPPEEMMAVNIVGHHMIHMIALSRLTTFPGEKQSLCVAIPLILWHRLTFMKDAKPLGMPWEKMRK